MDLQHSALSASGKIKKHLSSLNLPDHSLYAISLGPHAIKSQRIAQASFDHHSSIKTCCIFNPRLRETATWSSWSCSQSWPCWPSRSLKANRSRMDLGLHPRVLEDQQEQGPRQRHVQPIQLIRQLQFVSTNSYNNLVSKVQPVICLCESLEKGSGVWPSIFFHGEGSALLLVRISLPRASCWPYNLFALGQTDPFII